MNYETCPEIEVAVARHFGTRENIIVPNISWGMFGYELDLCILNIKTKWASEVEIKVSKSDLKADANKNHNHDHNGNYIKDLWFAMPLKLKDKGCEEFVPERAGIIYVNEGGFVRTIRKPIPNPIAKRWDLEKMFKLSRLGTLRIWNLKQDVIDLKRRNKELWEKIKHE
jgi:hypothetical protein